MTKQDLPQTTLARRLCQLAQHHEDEARALATTADAFRAEYENHLEHKLTPESHIRLVELFPYVGASDREAREHTETAALLRQAANLLEGETK